MPLKLIPPRKSPFWSVRGTYLGIYVERSTKASKRAVAAKSSSSGNARSNVVSLPNPASRRSLAQRQRI